MTQRLVVEMQSAVSGPLNPAVCDFSFEYAGSTLSQEEINAQVLLYVAGGLGVFAEESVSITGCTLKAPWDGPGIPQEFPAAEYAAGRAALNTALGSGIIKALSAYGVEPLGPVTATSSGRGDSVCVNTRASTAGAHGRGRHFLPFANRDTVGTDGLLNPASCAYVERLYRACFMNGESIPTFGTLHPKVVARATGVASDINVVQVNRIPSRLRSRTK
jgi:hypothetical protein